MRLRKKAPEASHLWAWLAPREAAGSGLGAPSALSTRCPLGKVTGSEQPLCTHALSESCPGTRAGGDASTQPLSSPGAPPRVSPPTPDIKSHASLTEAPQSELLLGTSGWTPWV